jgi:hypothetical protein
MDERFLTLCKREFELGVKMLFDALQNSVVDGESWLREIPYIGGQFVAALENPEHSLVPQVCRALCAREQFRQDAPSWAYQPLPLRQEDCDELTNHDNPRLNLVGYFASSWRYMDWDQQHPSFGRFCSGLMFYQFAPNNIRADSSLRQEFPPRELTGLCDGMLHWRSDATIVWDRQHQAWCAGTGPAPVRL